MPSPSGLASAEISTLPLSVNLKALPTTLTSIWRMWSSEIRRAGKAGSMRDSIATAFERAR